jgi:hypothetical protein
LTLSFPAFTVPEPGDIENEGNPATFMFPLFTCRVIVDFGLPATVPVAKIVIAKVFRVAGSYAVPDAVRVKLLPEPGLAVVATTVTAKATMTTQSKIAIVAFLFNAKSPVVT